MKALLFKSVLLLGCLMLVGVCAATAQQNNAEPPLITVTGQVEVKVVPDMVVFSLKVESLHKDLATN